MSFFSKVGGALKSVAKVAALPVTAPLKFQAKIGSQVLSTIARKIPTPLNIGGGSSGGRPPAIYGSPPASSAPAAPVGWRGMSLAPLAASSSASYGPATPAQQSMFPSIASAVNNLPAAPAASPLLPTPGYPMPAPTYGPDVGPVPTSSGYGGGAAPNLFPEAAAPGDYGTDAGPDDDGYDYTQGGDSEELGDIDYAAHFAQLGDWKSDLLNVAKGAASGALSAGANALTGGAKSAAAAAAAAKAKADAGLPLAAKVAIGAAIALPVGYLLLHRRHEPARARNPRRRRRTSTRSRSRRRSR